MKSFILCCALVCSTSAFADDAGVVDAGVSVADAGITLIAPSLDAPLLSAKGFYTAVKTGNGWLAAMFMLFFLVGAIRIVGKRIHAMIPDDTKQFALKPIEAFLRFVFDTKIGGWLLNWLSAVGGCLSTAAMAGLPVDAASWKVAILASTGGTALIELKDDVMEWWDKKNVEKAAAKIVEDAAKLAVVAVPPVPEKVEAPAPSAPAPSAPAPVVEAVAPVAEAVAPVIDPPVVKATKRKKKTI